MLENLDKSLMQNIFNSNEFKGWLISRRWFGYKSALSNLEFKVSIDYFVIISERIFITVIKIITEIYSKSYYLPLIFYRKIQDILEQSENNRNNIIRLTEITFSKKLALTIGSTQKVFTLNLVEAEYCIFFWKNILFNKDVIEKFPSLSLELTLYSEQFQDDIRMREVQTLIEASLFPNRYALSMQQLGGGDTTNSLFLLNLIDKRIPDQNAISFVLKSYKEYLESLEPSILFVLVKNNFPNAPKIYGTIKIKGIETVGIIENVQNIGNIGDVVWNELNDMIYDVFSNIKADYSHLSEKSEISNLTKNYFVETMKVSEEIGTYISKLHESLILPDERDYSIETVKSTNYLKNYTDKLNSIISDLQNNISQQSEKTFYNLPKINSILIDIKEIMEKFRSEFPEDKIKIQPVHQDLHMEQVLYNKINEQYQFYFIDYEGDPQLTVEDKKGKFPIEKDVASFLRSLSYIKFNTFLNFIEKKIIQRDRYEVPEEILYSLFFRKAVISKNKVLDVILKVLNVWEEKLMAKLIRGLKPNIILTNYFTIERALYELNYELLFRPNKIIVPILGLKEIIEKY
ncbi:MAG: hypothetical protein ACFE8A_00730 [Candidatus Hodarchaeota archaeon]